MKYIVVRDREDKEYAIVFPDAIIHKDVARIHRATDVRVVSAGFCSIGPTLARAWGESESIGIGSREIDSAIIGADFSELYSK